MSSRFFRLPLHEIGYVRAIVDGYDGLAVVRSPGAGRGEMEWIIGDGQDGAALDLAQRLALEVGLREIERPTDWPPLGDDDP